MSLEFRDMIVLRHRSGEGYQNISAALNVPKNTVSFLNGRSLEPPKLPRAGRPVELSNQWKSDFLREVTKNPLVTLTEL